MTVLSAQTVKTRNLVGSKEDLGSLQLSMNECQGFWVE